VSSAVRSQQDFLDLLRSSSPVSHISSSFNHVAANTAMLALPAPGSPSHVMLCPVGIQQPQQQQQVSGWTTALPAAPAQLPTYFTGAGPMQAVQAPIAGDSNATLLLLQQLSQLQQLMSQQQPQQQQVAPQDQQQPQQQHAAGRVGGQGVRSSSNSSSKSRGAAPAGAAEAGLLASLDKGKLQQLARQLQQQRKLQQVAAVRMGSCGISRVSSDLTQMLTLSVSASSEDSAEDGVSNAGDD
jgi:hypothetical protein